MSSSDLAKAVYQALLAKHMTLAVAESCTGGMLGAAMTDLPGVSAVFRGGVIAYHNDVKQSVLNVPAVQMANNGAVSELCAKSMARNVANMTQSSLGVSLTGIAGPEGGTVDKPVGLVYIGLSHAGHTHVHTHYFAGDRKAVRQQAVAAALVHIIQLLHAV
ncbi:MAG: nicotinamide-nucleotide amidohydrolase family protein [Pseudomonadota bacterium]